MYRAMRKIETIEFIAIYFAGLTSPKACGMTTLIFLVTIIIHGIINPEYLKEWTDFIFEK